MSLSNTSNTASPQTIRLAQLATRYFIEGDHTAESRLGASVDALLVEEDEETFKAVSQMLIEKDYGVEEELWDYARERAEMFLTEEGLVTTLFVIPVLNPKKMSGFSASKASASFVKHGIVCQSAKVTFFPTPVDGEQLLNMTPVELFRLHMALSNNRREVTEILGGQRHAHGVHPYVCLIGVVTYPAQLPGPCLAWELDAGHYLRRVKQWAEHVDQEALGQRIRCNALGIPGRCAFAVREGIQEYQGIVLANFVDRAVHEGNGKVLARLKDHPTMDGLTLELYDTTQEYGALFLDWGQLRETRAEVIEQVIDQLRQSGVSGILFDDCAPPEH